MDPTALTSAQLAYARTTAHDLTTGSPDDVRSLARSLIESDAGAVAVLALWGLATEEEFEALSAAYDTSAWLQAALRLDAACPTFSDIL